MVVFTFLTLLTDALMGTTLDLYRLPATVTIGPYMHRNYANPDAHTLFETNPTSVERVCLCPVT